MQYIVICMDDDKRYIQATRKRFLTTEAARYYKGAIAQSRQPQVVEVEDLPLDEDGYPILSTE